MTSASHPKVLFAVSEVYPLIKTGGLADVAGALPAALHALGVDIKLLIPGYREVLAKCRGATAFARLPNPFAPAQQIHPSEVYLIESHLAESGLPVLIVAHDAYFDRAGGPYQAHDGAEWPDNALRFGLLSYVAAWLGSATNTTAWQPDIVHCNDWQTGLAPAYLRFQPGRKAPSIMTVHNLAYQGVFGADWVSTLKLPPESFKIQGLEFYGHLSFLKAGLFYCDRITTVSPTYAREIQHESLGFGMHGLLRERRGVLQGIVNGIDTQAWNPRHDPHLVKGYDIQHLSDKAKSKSALQQALGLHLEADTPLVATVSRITAQKGSDIVLGVMNDLVAEGVQFALLGSGDKVIELAFIELARKHPGRISACIGYDEGQSHRMEAGADIFLMPSRFEPCGLNQMYSQRYGTPPVAHATGGLVDTIVDATAKNLALGLASGVLFYDMNFQTCLAAVRHAVHLYRHEPRRWRQLQCAGMAKDFSWENSAQEYLKLYRSLMASPTTTTPSAPFPTDA